MTISRHRCTSCLHWYLIIAALRNFILPVIILPQFVRYNCLQLVTGTHNCNLFSLLVAPTTHVGDMTVPFHMCPCNPIFHRLSDTSFKNGCTFLYLIRRFTMTLMLSRMDSIEQIIARTVLMPIWCVFCSHIDRRYCGIIDIESSSWANCTDSRYILVSASRSG